MAGTLRLHGLSVASDLDAVVLEQLVVVQHVDNLLSLMSSKWSAFSAGVDAGTPRWHPPVLDGRGPLAKAAGAGMVPRLSAAFFIHTGCMRPGG